MLGIFWKAFSHKKLISIFLSSLFLLSTNFAYAEDVPNENAFHSLKTNDNIKDAHSRDVDKKGSGVSIKDTNFSSIPNDMPSPVNIGVTFMLDEVSKIDEAAGIFEGSISLELEWLDPSLAFDPHIVGAFHEKFCLEKADEKLTQIWNPKIIVSNMLNDSSKKTECVMIYADGRVLLAQKITGKFKSKFMLNAFPFDTQHLQVKLMSDRYEYSELRFIQSQEEINHSGIHNNVKLEGWELEGLQFQNDKVRGLSHKYMADFTINVVIRRLPISQLFSFAPLLLIILLPTIVTLYSKVDMGTRLGYWSGAILALIALNFTLNLRYPALGSQSLLAELITIVFFYEFVMICLCLTVLNNSQKSLIKNPYIIPEVNKCLQWFVPLGFLVLVIGYIVLTMLSP